MTHDLFVSFAHAFGVKLKEVFIYKFEDGIFSSELTFTDGDRTIVLDSRTSDAIGIALRTKSPIYTTKDILDETGFILEETEANRWLNDNVFCACIQRSAIIPVNAGMNMDTMPCTA